MSSLTPASRNQEATWEAFQEGLVSGGMVFVPTLGSLYVAMQSKTFMARTNWQSRTAMVIMPALFTFAWTAEHYLHYKMTEIAGETQHNTDTVKWAERQIQAKQQQHQQKQQESSQPSLSSNNNKPTSTMTPAAMDKELHLLSLYKRSVEESGVTIVPGSELQWHHRLANFVSANPIKSLSVVAVPSVALILYGRTGQEHLQLSMKLLHTRVFGQFTTIALLLSIMGFKSYMDQYGKFITEEEANRRVEEMQRIREQLTERLEYEHSQRIKHQQETNALGDSSSSSKSTGKKQPKKKKPTTTAASTNEEAKLTPETSTTTNTLNQEPQPTEFDNDASEDLRSQDVEKSRTT